MTWKDPTLHLPPHDDLEGSNPPSIPCLWPWRIQPSIYTPGWWPGRIQPSIYPPVDDLVGSNPPSIPPVDDLVGSNPPSIPPVNDLEGSNPPSRLPLLMTWKDPTLDLGYPCWRPGRIQSSIYPCWRPGRIQPSIFPADAKSRQDSQLSQAEPMIPLTLLALFIGCIMYRPTAMLAYSYIYEYIV